MKYNKYTAISSINGQIIRSAANDLDGIIAKLKQNTRGQSRCLISANVYFGDEKINITDKIRSLIRLPWHGKRGQNEDI